MTNRLQTFSIVAFDKATSSHGIAVASKFLAVGSIVPHLKANVGAIATQSLANMDFGKKGIDLLQQGENIQNLLQKILFDDDFIEERQLGIVDSKGNSINFTGKCCSAWAGGVSGDGYAIQGNMLTGKNVILSMEETYLDSMSLEFSHRLINSLQSGDLVGGDKRGKQSASIVIVKENSGYGGIGDVSVDLRVDDHPSPIQELKRLLLLHEIFFGKSDKKNKVTISNSMIINFKKLFIRLGYYQGEIDHKWLPAFTNTLFLFFDMENLENRIDITARTIDYPAIIYLKEKYPELELREIK